MKKASSCFLFLILLIVSFKVDANIDELIHSLEHSYAKAEWREFDQQLTEFEEANIKISRNHDLRIFDLKIQSLLARHLLDYAIDHVIDAGCFVFPKLEQLRGKRHSQDDLLTELKRILLRPTSYLTKSTKKCDAAFIPSLSLHFCHLLVQLDKLDEALDLCTKLALDRDELLTASHLAQFYLCKGEIAFYAQNEQAALREFKRALSLLEEPEAEIHLKNGAYLWLCATALATSDSESFAKFRQILEQQKNQLTAAQQTRLLLLDCQWAFVQHQQLTAEEFARLESAATHFNQREDIFSLALTLELQALAYLALSPNNAAISENYSKRAWDIAQKKSLPLLARLLRNEDYQSTQREDGDEASSGSEENDPHEV